MKLLDYMRKSGNALGAVFNAVFLWAVLFVISCCLYTKHTWGTVSLPQLIFFAQSGTADGIEQRLIFEIVGYCLALPIALTWLLLYAVKKYAKAKVLFCNRLFFALCLAGLWGVTNYCLPLKTVCPLYYLVCFLSAEPVAQFQPRGGYFYAVVIFAGGLYRYSR